MYNRRNFIKQAAAVGGFGLLNPTFSSAADKKETTGYFKLHPFIENHPDSVFVMRTHIDVKTNSDAKKDSGVMLSRSVFMPSDKTGIPVSNLIPVKPNLTWSDVENKNFKLEDGLGIVSDPFFIEGIIGGMKETGISGDRFNIREVNSPEHFGPRGFIDMARRTGADIRLDMGKDIENLPSEYIVWKDIPDGVIHERLPYLWPVNAKDTFYLNIAKLKSHFVGLTLTCKNNQGTIASKYQRFCHGEIAITDYKYKHLVRGAIDNCRKAHKKHVSEGYPYLEMDPLQTTFLTRMEIWCNRTLDNISATKMGLCIIDGTYGRDGCFYAGPNPPKNNVKGINEAWDRMTNFVVFGKNPLLVDIVGHWLGGHEPGNFALFRIAHERGLTDIIDPRKIPVYEWENGSANRVSIENMKRTPIPAPYLHKSKDYPLDKEIFEIYDEPVEYSKFGETVKPGPIEPDAHIYPGIKPHPSNPLVLIEYSMPRSDYAQIDIVDKNGARVETILNGYCDKGYGCSAWNTMKYSPREYKFVFRTADYAKEGFIIVTA